MNQRQTHALLAVLVVFDVSLVVWAFAFPDLWFQAFHGTDYDDPQGLLRRCGANWAAFALVQAIALVRWRKDRVWLAVVAGVRLSDIFTDATYVVVARDTTWFALVTLAPMSAINVLLGWLLLRAYRGRAAAGAGPAS